ncbi:MAG: FtsX-like permease family protein, partial [Candidatus Babeliales bacterium]
THDQIGEEKLIEKMKQFFQLHICSWKDLYPTLLSAIKLEKYSMIFILMLICLVASSNIIALLFMFILKKQGDIALFLSLGMQRHQIKAIFTLLSLFLIGSATCIGLLLSTLTAFIFQRYPFIQLPDIYETTYLPIALNIDNLIFVLGATVCIGLIASWIPVHRITYVTIATLLRGNR